MDFENNYKKFLKDTGCKEDEAMSRKEMMELEAAINNSKDTASLEEEKREYVRKAEEMQVDTTETDSTLKQRRSASKSPVDIFESEPEEQPSQKEFEITFQDMPECSKESLEIIYHEPVYKLPIPFNPKYQKCSITERTKLLCNYYTKLSQLRTKLAKGSLRRAPFSKPILPSNKGKISLLKGRLSEDEGAEEPGQIPPQEFYVSRAGRQIKRKIYTEDPELDDFEVSSVKKNKFINSDTKITLDTPFVPEENHTDEKITPKPVKIRKDTPTRRSLLLTSAKKLGRSESLFGKLRDDEAKKKQKQQEMEEFEKTLPTVAELDDEDKLLMYDVEEAPAETSDENFVRRRVVPPIPGRRPAIRAKKQPSIEDFDKIDVVPASPPSSPKILKQYTNLNKSVTITKSNTKTPKPKENQSKAEIISKLDKMPCPICSKKFLQSEIEDHAANCGIEEDIEEPPKEASGKLRCELCEKEFMANTSYEVHVKQCIAKTVSDL